MTDKRLFSGIQPTGEIHLGNYIGALRNWVAMQDEYSTIYCVVDLHAITLPQDPAELRAATVRTAKSLLAVGIDPARSLVYVQSHVPQHVELSWVLGTITGMGHLSRMTQYKEKSDKGGQQLGIFAYPVLQAADILIHRVHAVPVGEDQSQHLELTRDLAERFNARFGETFPLPETVTPKIGGRVMSLKDPTAKMSKSDPDPKSRIIITDSPDVIRKKVRSAVTDSGTGVHYDVKAKAGISNLLDIMAVMAGRSIDDLVAEHADMQYGPFKDAVADAVIAGLEPFRTSFAALSDDEVRDVMKASAARALESAETSMQGIRDAVGLG
jgi:tryptophanyl-tRNA synthetase